MSILPLFLAMISVVMISSVFAKQENGKTNETKTQKETRVSKIENLKNFEKASQTKSNAQLLKENVEEVSVNLMGVAEEKKAKAVEKSVEKKPVATSNKKVAETQISPEVEAVETLEEVAIEVEQSGEDASVAIEEVEKTNKFMKLLVGSDYKNLGQLRSSLVRNRNQIRQLTSLMERTTDEAEKTAISEQLVSLMQEKERIKTVISDNEEGFSLLGWAFRFLSGYVSAPATEEAEDQALENEVAEVLENADADEATDVTEPVVTTDGTVGDVPVADGGTADVVPADGGQVVPAVDGGNVASEPLQ